MLAVSFCGWCGIIFCQNGFNLPQIGGKVDILQLFRGAQSHFYHMVQLGTQPLVVPVQVIQDAGAVKPLDGLAGNDLTDLL